MLNIALPNPASGPCKILCLGSHCDDIEIGCGGSVLRLLAERRCEVHWIVFASTPPRKVEAERAAALFLQNAAASQVAIHGFRDSFFPYVGAQIKEEFELLKARISPDLIFTHTRDDLHQDHRIVNELTWNTFRNHLILEYEIPKYDGDLGSPNFFVHLNEDYCRRKSQYLIEAFVSQRAKAWFTEDTFAGLMRLRGVESNSPGKFAEGFYCRKMAL